MRLILELGYSHLVFPQGANVTGSIAGLDGAVLCDKSGYGATEQYTRSTSYSEVGVKILPDADVRLPDVSRPEVLEILVARDKELNDLRTKFYAQSTELKAAKATIERYQGAVTPPAPPAAPVLQDIPL